MDIVKRDNSKGASGDIKMKQNNEVLIKVRHNGELMTLCDYDFPQISGLSKHLGVIVKHHVISGLKTRIFMLSMGNILNSFPKKNP